MPRSRQFCTFFIDNLYFGIEAEKVQEILSPQQIKEVPLSPACVKGLINIRGQIVIVLDLSTRLSLKQSEESEHMNVIAKGTDGPVSLMVDKIGDVIEVDESFFEPPPDTLEEQVKGLIKGVYKLEDCLLHYLAVDKVIKVA